MIGNFGDFLAKASTSDMLDRMIVDNARTDGAIDGMPASRPCDCCGLPGWYRGHRNGVPIYRCLAGHPVTGQGH